MVLYKSCNMPESALQDEHPYSDSFWLRYISEMIRATANLSEDARL